MHNVDKGNAQSAVAAVTNSARFHRLEYECP